MPVHVMKALTQEMLDTLYPLTSWTQVYTDGSADSAIKNGGAGVYIKYPDGRTENLATPGGKRCTNFKAEALAIETATDHLVQHRQHGNCVFLTDSKSVLQKLVTDAHCQELQLLHHKLSTLASSSTTILQWIPAHIGVSGNEKADQLAKSGSLLPQPDYPLTYPETKTLIRNVFKTTWIAQNNGYRSSQDPVGKLDRAEQAVIHRLRTGHCRLKSHLSRIGCSDSPECPCGSAQQTPVHILQDCKLFSKQRNEMWPIPTDSNTKLWGNEEDLSITSRFTTSLGVKI